MGTPKNTMRTTALILLTIVGTTILFGGVLPALISAKNIEGPILGIILAAIFLILTAGAVVRLTKQENPRT